MKIVKVKLLNFNELPKRQQFKEIMRNIENHIINKSEFNQIKDSFRNCKYYKIGKRYILK